MAASKHPSSIVLDHCWVCAARFVGNGGTALREDHHVIPRAYGGTDGPTVTICETHHGKLHKIAVALKSHKPYFTLLGGEDAEATKKILWLASQVYNADLATANDPNKAGAAMIMLTARHKAMIDKLKPIYPAAKSREAVFLLALEALYHKNFVQ